VGGSSGTQFQRRTKESPIKIIMKEAGRSTMDDMSVIPSKIVPVNWMRKIAGYLPRHKPE
jgi:hypothetical protein